MKYIAIIVWIAVSNFSLVSLHQARDSDTLNTPFLVGVASNSSNTSIASHNHTHKRQQEIDDIQHDASILSSKIMSFTKLSTASSASKPTGNIMNFWKLRKIQPRANPLAPLLALLRILLLPLRILLAPVIILLRALIELLRLILRLLNPIFLAFAFLGALNMAANIARIILMILRIIFQALRRRKEDKDEERDVKVITIVEEHTSLQQDRHYHMKKPKHKKKGHHSRPKTQRIDFSTSRTIEDIVGRERLIISKLTCLGALTTYPANRIVPSDQRWVTLDPYIESHCGFNAILNPSYLE